MDKKRAVASVLATAMALETLTGGPYSVQGFKLPKPSKRPVGRAMVCCKCGLGNITLRKFSDDKRICQKCYEKHKDTVRYLHDVR